MPIRRHPGEPVPRASREVPTPGRPQAASQAPHGADGLSGARAYPENLVARAHNLTGVGGVEACAHDQHGPAGARLAQLPDRVRAVAAWGVQVQRPTASNLYVAARLPVSAREPPGRGECKGGYGPRHREIWASSCVGQEPFA